MIARRNTDYGRLEIGTPEELFARAVEIIAGEFARADSLQFTLALSGGQTPQNWYKWCVGSKALPPSLVSRVHFTVSDERHVPIASPESNFGTAGRLLLDPLGVRAENRHAWPVSLPPVEAAESYGLSHLERRGPGRTYDVCMLGMGDDSHTASFFPGSSILSGDGGRPFAAIEVPGRGWRLTVTPTGLCGCGLIAVMVLGASKAPGLRKVLTGTYDPSSTPAQILKTCAGRVVWLVDEAAASGVLEAAS